MTSRWFELKAAAILLRQNGQSLSFIASNLGIPRSTLFGWLKDVPLTPLQRHSLKEARLHGLIKGRIKITESRLEQSKELEKRARDTLTGLDLTPQTMELALAALYCASTTVPTTISSSDSLVVRFIVLALNQLYGVPANSLKCRLQLRSSQETQTEILYWSKLLGIPASNFKKVTHDKRTRGIAPKDYHGICTLYFSRIAIHQKLVYLYRLFCEKALETGARSSVG